MVEYSATASLPIGILMFKCLHGLSPNYLCDPIVYTHDIHSYNTPKRPKPAFLSHLEEQPISNILSKNKAQICGILYLLLSKKPQLLKYLSTDADNGYLQMIRNKQLSLHHLIISPIMHYAPSFVILLYFISLMLLICILLITSSLLFIYTPYLIRCSHYC